MKTLAFCCAALLAGLTNLNGALAQQEENPRAEDEKAILQRTQAVEDAVNARDVAAYVALYTRNADAINEAGQVAKGRKGIRAAMQQRFSEFPAEQKVKLASESVRFIGRNVAVQDVKMTAAGAAEGGPDEMRVTVVLVKRQGKWLAACARFMVPHAASDE